MRPPPPSRTASWILTCALLAAACESAPAPTPGGDVEIGAAPQVLVTTESALIGGLADMAVGADGRIFLLDAGQAVVNMVELREQILEGEVPALLLNAANAVVGRDGSVWLTVAAAARVERYAPDGARLFRIDLTEPEFPAVRAAWIERTAEMETPGIPGLNYLLRVREVGGDLWILTHSGGDEGAKIVAISPGGEVERRLHFSLVDGASNFAVDEQRGRIYFYVPDTAEVVGVELGAALEVTAG